MMGGLFIETADAQINVNLRAHLGSNRIYAPAARIAVEEPVYQERSIYTDQDYNRGGYRQEEQRFDNRDDRNGQRREQEQRFDRGRNYDQQYQGNRGGGNRNPPAYGHDNGNRQNRVQSEPNRFSR